MAKTHKRRNLERRLAEMGFELKENLSAIVGWVIIPNGTPKRVQIRLGAHTLDSVRRIADWLEEQGLTGLPEPPDEGLDAEHQDAKFLRSIAESSINALETGGYTSELIVLLGWLKQTIKGLDPDYDVAQDPT